jgi:hypothetical protein
MRRLSYEEAVQELTLIVTEVARLIESVDSGRLRVRTRDRFLYWRIVEESLFVMLDVRWQPRYWLDLKSEAARRRDRAALTIIKKAETDFRPYDAPGAGRPREDPDARRARMEPRIAGDVPAVAEAVARLWSDRGNVSALFAFANRFMKDAIGYEPPAGESDT